MLAAAVAGILLSYFEPLPVCPTLLVAAASFVLLLVAGFFLPRLREPLWGGAALVFFFCFSLWHTTRALQKAEWNELSTTPTVYPVQVLETPVERAKSWQVHVILANRKEAVLFLQKDSTLRLPEPGDRLLVRTAISRPRPADEFSFDYGRYLQLQGIAGTGVVAQGGMLYIV